jgi:hypothetical protein
MEKFNMMGGQLKQAKTTHSFLTSSTGTTGCSIKGIHEDEEIPRRHETSLNKNIINTPKNMRRFTFLKNTTGNGYKNSTMEEIKNTSLPKTASTMNQNRT